MTHEHGGIPSSIRELLLAVMQRFPEVAFVMKARAKRLRSVRFSTTDMLEAFASETRKAVQQGDLSKAHSHLHFVDSLLRKADEAQRQYIDVYYLEGLMRGSAKSDERAISLLMPANLRNLHAQAWDTPRVKGAKSRARS